MAFGVGDELSVRLSAQTQSFESSMEGAQDSLNSVRNSSATTSAALTALSERVDEVGDQMARTERKASSLTRSFGALTAATSALNTSFMGISAVQLSGLIAGFGTLATTIAPLVSSLLGVAAATAGVAAGFGAVIGTGIFAYAQDLTEEASKQRQELAAQIEELQRLREAQGELTDAQERELRTLQKKHRELKSQTSLYGALAHEMQPVTEQLKESAAVLGDPFIPLIRDAIDALPDFIETIEESVGNLQPFADALADAGEVASEVIPNMVGYFLDLGREGLPVVRDFGSWLANSWRPIIESSVQTLRELGGLLLDTMQAIGSFLGPLNDFGTAVLQTVLPSMNAFLERLGEVFNAVESNAQIIKAVLVGSFIAVTGPLGAVIALLVNFREEVANAFGDLNSQYIEPFVAGFESAFDNQLATVVSETGETLALFIDNIRNLLGLSGDIESYGEETAQSLNRIQNSLIALNSVAQGEQTLAEAFNSDELAEVQEFLTPLTEEMGDLRDEMGDTIDVVTSSLEPTFNSLQSILQDNEAEIQNFATAVRGAMTGFVNFLRTFVQPAIRYVFTNVLAPIINTVSNSIADNLGPVLSEVTQTINTLASRANYLGNVMMQIWTRIDSIVLPVVDALVNGFSRLAGYWIDQFAQGLMLLMNLIQGDFSGAMDNLDSMLQNLIDFNLDLVSIFRGGINAAISWIQGDGQELIGQVGDAFLNGLENFPSNVADLFVEAFSGLQSTVNSALGLPWKVQIPKVNVPGAGSIGGDTITVPAFGGSASGSSGMGFTGEGQGDTTPYYEGFANRQQMQQSVQNAAGASQERLTNVAVRIEGDADLVREAAVEVVDDQKRRTRREQGNTTNLG